MRGVVPIGVTAPRGATSVILSPARSESWSASLRPIVRTAWIVQDLAGQPAGVLSPEVAAVHFLLQHLRDQPPHSLNGAISLFDVPVVSADHQTRLVRQDFDRFVKRLPEECWTQQRRPRQVQPDVAVDERESQQLATPRKCQMHQ